MWRGSDDSWVCAYSHEYIFFVNNYLCWEGIESEEDAAAHLSVLYPSDDSYDAHGIRGGGQHSYAGVPRRLEIYGGCLRPAVGVLRLMMVNYLCFIDMSRRGVNFVAIN